MSEGKKYDGGKLRYDLVPTLALEEVVKVITKGAEKYDDENWKNVPNGRKRYYAATQRHLMEWRKGNIYDEEMETHHIANAISNLLFILEKELEGLEDVEETPTPKTTEDSMDGWGKETVIALAGWTRHDGSDPAHIDRGTIVQVLTKRAILCGDSFMTGGVEFFEWTHVEEDDDIAFYRIVK